DEDTYLTVDQSEFIGQHIIEWSVNGVLFYLGDIVDDWDMLDILNKLGAVCTVHATLLQQGMEDPSIFIKANIKGTQAIIDTAITAGIHMLICTSATSVVFIGTDIMNVNKQVPSLENPFDVCNDAQ
ncbi:hypothetical protein F5J12DRAFT_703990, partial [Pisolithus orientalis]|uniref:uncharacterized protein n=1 Tax=Pisolithus orientalis TaxID=936130 RepID=UPI002224781B